MVESQTIMKIDLLQYCKLRAHGNDTEAQKELERIAESGDADFLEGRLPEVAEKSFEYYNEKAWAYGNIVEATYSSSKTFTFKNNEGSEATSCITLGSR